MDTARPAYLPSIDALRALAAFAVVTLHTKPFVLSGFFEPMEACQATAVALNVLALFAVPFFFAASGFFMGRAIPSAGGLDAEAGKTALRTLKTFVFWTLFFFLVPGMTDIVEVGPWFAMSNAFLSSVHHAVTEPVHLLLAGGSYQLWFLSSLFQAVCIVWLFERLGSRRALLALAVGLYLFGLLGQGYRGLLTAPLSLNTRTGPFFALLPFVLGFCLAKGNGWKARNALLLALGGLLMIFIEVRLLVPWNADSVRHYYLGSVPLALGLLMAGLARPEWAANTILPRLGRMSLGIYATHTVFIEWMEGYDFPFMESAVWQLAYPVMVFLLAWGASEGMARVPGLSEFCGRGRRGKAPARLTPETSGT